MSILSSYLLNVAGSVSAMALLYGLYIACAYLFSSKKAKLEMWWLPEFHCWRVVIRNIPIGYEITDLRSNAWLRYIVPRTDRCSVNSFRDIDLVHSERIVITKTSDLPIACFRLRQSNDDFEFIFTDKFGTEMASHKLSGDFEQLSIQYSAKIQTFKLFKYEIYRSFAVPRFNKSKGEVLKAIFEFQQIDKEGKFPWTFLTAEVIRVSI